MSTYQPGRSLSVAQDGYMLLHTVDQRLVAYDADGVQIAVTEIPPETLHGMTAQMERLNEVDAAQRKRAWEIRWHNPFGGARQALYHNVNLSADYDKEIVDGVEVLQPPSAVDSKPDDRRRTENLDEAQVVSSEALDAQAGYLKMEDYHRPILDIDFPAHVYPSSTEGHNHLYLDRMLTWEKYEALLKALGDAEILEPGYVSASLARKHTAVRLPWVKKEDQ